MTRRRRRSFEWFAVLLVSILIASGCSGPASSASTEAAPQSPTSPPATVVATTVAEEGVLFQDDFTNPEGGWPIVDVDNYRFGYHPPDFYHAELKSSNDTLS